MELMQDVNTDSLGWFGPLLLLAIAILVFMGLKWGTTPAKAASVACFISFVCALVMLTLGLVTWYIVVVCFVLTGATTAASFFEG